MEGAMVDVPPDAPEGVSVGRSEGVSVPCSTYLILILISRVSGRTQNEDLQLHHRFVALIITRPIKPPTKQRWSCTFW